jgi:hypothetical protein
MACCLPLAACLWRSSVVGAQLVHVVIGRGVLVARGSSEVCAVEADLMCNESYGQ